MTLDFEPQEHRRVRDPVHGFVVLTKDESALLDTPVLQRLRRIRQLALASLVYPGAVHTRFEHTLGVLHVAGALCTRLKVDARYAPLIRLAALLHDAGHGPFSHVSEIVLDTISASAIGVKAGKKDKIHELITQKIILEHPDLSPTLSPGDRQNVVDLLSKGLKEPLYRAIVSGPLDADKQDYLLRDSLFCGVQYGLFDIAQLHNVLLVGKDGQSLTLMVDHRGIHVIEQFILAKYYLTTQVYRHKLRLITDAMLVRALVLGVQTDKLDFLQRLYTYEDSPAYITNYLAWYDERLFLELLQKKHINTNAGGLFRRLFERRLFKRVFQASINALDGVAKIGFAERFMAVRSELEKAAAEKLSSLVGAQIQPEHVILHHHAIDTVREQSRNSERSILVQMRPATKPFEEASTLFKPLDERAKEEYIECYAPVDPGHSAPRDKIETEMTGLITSLLREKIAHKSETSEGKTP